MKLTMISQGPRQPLILVLMLVLTAPGAAAENVLRLQARDGGRDGRVVLIANLDDDDRDGLPDAADNVINGVTDLLDTTPLVIEADDPAVTAVRLTSDSDAIRFFRPVGRSSDRKDDAEAAAWEPLAGRPLPLVAGRGEVRLECRQWIAAEPGWNGCGRIEAVGLEAAGNERGRGLIEAVVAPVRLVAETAAVRQVFVAAGRYDNAEFVTGLRELLGAMDVPLVVHQAGSWQEMWMQDTMELAATAVPGRQPVAMTVVLAGLRGKDPFPETLLGPDVAIARVAEPRPLAGGDAWADWYGNLTVSPATEAWPEGRVIYGRNSVTGDGFHPEVVRFLAAQRAQPPIWIDTSWLLIKHVDEIVAFLPGRDGKGVMLVPDPLAGLEAARAAGLPAASGPAGGAFASANRRIAAMIDEMLTGRGEVPLAGDAGKPAPSGGLLALLDWDPARVIRLPVAFEPPDDLAADGAVQGATAIWSNPVNMLFVNGTVICGRAGMPAGVIDACRHAFEAAGGERVVFVDDACYQRAKGNVHCATNTRREPPAEVAEEIPRAPSATVGP
jgi:protein-arginine deiminase